MNLAVIYYVIISFMFAGIFNFILDINLEQETDKETIELFNNKSVKYVSIILISLFWFITIMIILKDNWKARYNYDRQ